MASRFVSIIAHFCLWFFAVDALALELECSVSGEGEMDPIDTEDGTWTDKRLFYFKKEKLSDTYFWHWKVNKETLRVEIIGITELPDGGEPVYRRSYFGICTKIADATEPTPAEPPEAIAPMPVFREPEMVTVPAGRFIMGMDMKNMGPAHTVTIASAFELGKFAVTFEEWDTCVKEGGCKFVPPSAGWGRGRRPVINVSWIDVTRQYIPWLNRKTGKTFRLPSEAEWEYAARAGATTRFFWGDEPGRGHANCKGCGSPWDNKQTAPVGSFPPNAFGLYDMAGNVWQWVQDSNHGSYDEAPTDGSVWTGGDPSSRIQRGGAWDFAPFALQPGIRVGDKRENRSNSVGFRLARTP